MDADLRQRARDEVQRLRGGNPHLPPWVCGLEVSDPRRLSVSGVCGATPLGCEFCGRALSGMGGPGLVCMICATALRDPQHPLGMLLRDAWQDALYGLWKDETGNGR